MSDRVEHAVLAMDSLAATSAEGVDVDGDVEASMLLTFSGRTVVDGRLDDTTMRVAIPAGMFVPVLMHLHQVAASKGYAAPLPFDQCASQLIGPDQIDPTAHCVWRCTRDRHLPTGRHISALGRCWTDDQAVAAWEEFDRG